MGDMSLNTDPIRAPTLVELTAACGRVISEIINLRQNQEPDDARVFEIETHLQGLIRLFPDPLHPGSRSALHLRYLFTPLLATNTEFSLHIHGSITATTIGERSRDLGQCIADAQATVQTLQRTTSFEVEAEPPASGGEERQSGAQTNAIRRYASTFLCRHLLRCVLVLCLALDFEAALVCVRTSIDLGNARSINSKCAHSALHFLDMLQERIVSGRGSKEHLERDEEMIAYLSAEATCAWTNDDRHYGATGASRSPAESTTHMGTDATHVETSPWHLVAQVLQELLA